VSYLQNHYAPGDHAQIAQVIQREIRHRWVVSYDNAPEIVAFFAKRRSFEYDLQYNALRAYKGREVIIFSDAVKVSRQSKVIGVDKALRGFQSSSLFKTPTSNRDRPRASAR